ncbi:MAG: hypothetical protein A2096_15560 [Spirochaetes bacterium GWF1_41_5]|nr:MAG: hypothetical protein A2096_15560 [Spirochaetes bacterium GWF1_41_5]
MPEKKKLANAVNDLKNALKYKNKALKNNFFYAGIAKCFETCFEYTWKYFKQYAIKEGLEVFSPRDSIKAAGRLGLIADVEKWLAFLENRNIAVHDYLGISHAEYLKTISNFYREVGRINFP